MVCLSRPYTLKFFEGYIPQNLLSWLLNTLSHMYIQVKFSQVNNIVKLFLNGIRIHFAEGLKWVTLSSSVSGFVFTLEKGTPPWIDPTGVCAWLIFTIRVRSV